MSTDLCPKCNEWKKEDYPLCYTCSMKESGKLLCPICNDVYYDPKKFKCCYTCYGPKFTAYQAQKDKEMLASEPTGPFHETPQLVFLDTETTGFKFSRLVQLAYIRMEYGKAEPTNAVNLLVRPHADIELGATEVHGIRNEDVHDLAPFEETEEYKELQGLANKSVIICHNAKFDRGILITEGILAPYYICTLEIAKKMMPLCRDHKLQTLRTILALKGDDKAHDAMGDVEVLIELFKHLFLLYKAQTGKDDLRTINDFISLSR